MFKVHPAQHANDLLAVSIKEPYILNFKPVTLLKLTTLLLNRLSK